MRTRLDDMLDLIRKEMTDYERKNNGFFVVGVEIVLELSHAHVKVFYQGNELGRTTLVGFYEMSESDFDWLKEKLMDAGMYFRKNKGSGYTFVKICNH